jgi:hypothetical protein
VPSAHSAVFLLRGTSQSGHGSPSCSTRGTHSSGWNSREAVSVTPTSAEDDLEDHRLRSQRGSVRQLIGWSWRTHAALANPPGSATAERSNATLSRRCARLRNIGQLTDSGGQVQLSC